MYQRSVMDGIGVGWELDASEVNVVVGTDGTIQLRVAGRVASSTKMDTVAPASSVVQWTAEELALIESCRARIEELKQRRPVRGLDPYDLAVAAVRRFGPAATVSAAEWLLIASGLASPTTIEGVLTSAAVVRSLARRTARRRSPASDVRTVPVYGPPPLFRRGTVRTVLFCILESLDQASRIDDSELEDELDAFYPMWSPVDFEWDPRRYGSRKRLNRVRNPHHRAPTSPAAAARREPDTPACEPDHRPLRVGRRDRLIVDRPTSRRVYARRGSKERCSAAGGWRGHPVRRSLDRSDDLLGQHYPRGP